MTIYVCDGNRENSPKAPGLTVQQPGNREKISLFKYEKTRDLIVRRCSDERLSLSLNGFLGLTR